MHKKKKSEKMEHLVSNISQWLEGVHNIPSVLTDRALKIGALSFFVLFFGSYMGRQMRSASFVFWSVAICIFGLVYAFRLLKCGEKKAYETVEGMVYEIKGKYSIGRVYQVGIQMEDGRMTRLLMDKRYRFRIGRRYRFYFNQENQNVLLGIKNLDAALHVGSFYGAEELE